MPASDLDSHGRPVVVVTGTGVLTSLGQGKADNWQRADRRRLRHHAASAASRSTACAPPSPAPSTSSRSRTVPPPRCRRRCAVAVIEEAVAEVGHRRQGRLPRAAVPRPAAGRDGMAAAPGPRRRRRRQRGRWATTTCCAPPRPAASSAYYERFLFGSVAENLADRFGTKGSPDRHLHRLCLGRHRDPARRRGDPPRRGGGRALRRHRCLDQPGKPDPLLAALGAVHPQRSAGRGLAPVQQGPRRLRDGRGRRRAGDRKPRPCPRPRRHDPGRRGRLRREWRTASTAPAPHPDGKPIIACMRHALDDAGVTPDQVDYINAHGTGTPENDKMEWLGVSAGVRRARRARSRFPPTSR